MVDPVLRNAKRTRQDGGGRPVSAYIIASPTPDRGEALETRYVDENRPTPQCRARESAGTIRSVVRLVCAPDRDVRGEEGAGASAVMRTTPAPRTAAYPQSSCTPRACADLRIRLIAVRIRTGRSSRAEYAVLNLRPGHSAVLQDVDQLGQLFNRVRRRVDDRPPLLQRG